MTEERKRAVVVINNDANKAFTVTVSIPNAGKLVTATPEELEAKPSTGTLQIPARSAVILMELHR